METDEEKNCKNCKNFRQHYIKTNTRIAAVHCAHCVNPKIFSTRKCFEPRKNCDQWESNEGQKAERRESIKTLLRDMHNRLKEIEAILKDDE